MNFWLLVCALSQRNPLLIATQALYRKGRRGSRHRIDELDAVQPFEDEIGLDYLSLIGKAEGMSLMQAFGNPGHLPFTLLLTVPQICATGNRRDDRPEIEAWLKPLFSSNVDPAGSRST